MTSRLNSIRSCIHSENVEKVFARLFHRLRVDKSLNNPWNNFLSDGSYILRKRTEDHIVLEPKKAFSNVTIFIIHVRKKSADKNIEIEVRNNRYYWPILGFLAIGMSILPFDVLFTPFQFLNAIVGFTVVLLYLSLTLWIRAVHLRVLTKYVKSMDAHFRPRSAEL